MSFNFVICPECKEVIHLERIGPVGLLKGRPDSKIIKCLACTHVFRTEGNTWKEEHGYLKV